MTSTTSPTRSRGLLSTASTALTRLSTASLRTALRTSLRVTHWSSTRLSSVWQQVETQPRRTDTSVLRDDAAYVCSLPRSTRAVPPTESMRYVVLSERAYRALTGSEPLPPADWRPSNHSLTLTIWYGERVPPGSAGSRSTTREIHIP